MSNDDIHLSIAQENIGWAQAQLQQAHANYNVAIAQGDRSAANVAQDDIATLTGKIENYQNQVRKHYQAKQPRQGPPPVSQEARAQRLPHELDAYDLGKITGLQPDQYVSYKQYYDNLKARKVID